MCGCLQEPEGGISFPGSGVIGDCEPPITCGYNLWVLEFVLQSFTMIYNSYTHCVRFIFEIEG